MLYSFVKIFARIAIHFYCRNVQINKPELLRYTGPLLLASNHPNSFLDAIILCTLFDRPVYSLARGDAFNGNVITKILTGLKLLPVYRISEGVEHLEENYKTFDLCKEIFKQNGIVLIFCEGRCINEWHLRPIKKGAARLAISSWADNILLSVLPVGINYSSFRKFGKNVQLFFGDFITTERGDMPDSHGKEIKAFNVTLQKQLEHFVFEINKNDKQELHKRFYATQSNLKKVLLFIPSIAGWILHAPLYFPLRKFVLKKAKENDHFDSLMVAILFLGYPVFLISISLLVFLISRQYNSFLLLLIFPFTAWAHLQLKKQLD